ncbi:choline transporter-like protein 2 [Liolophura sinensis]|uniref:choline transporter-like protein 2 n=1 Tax=Liolophura sinensis TaxID=3198878 RepID=UPI003158770F
MTFLFTGYPTPYDPTFKGPIKNRSCTDVICCILFFIFLAGMVACSALGFIHGNPIQLIYPTDSEGNICGTGSKKNQPNLFFFDLLKCYQSGPGVAVQGCPTPQICVRECPSSYYVYVESLISNNKSELICKDSVDVTTTTKDINALVLDEDCAAYTVPSSPVLGRCVPSIFSDLVDLAATLSTNNKTLENAEGTPITGELLQTSSKFLAYFMSAAEFGERIFKDILDSWWLILVFLTLTMFLSFIWIVLLRWIAGIIVWVSIFAVLGGLGFCETLFFHSLLIRNAFTHISYMCLIFTTLAMETERVYYTVTQYLTLRDHPEYSGLPVVFTINLAYYINLKETWLGLAIISSIVLVILVLMLVFLCGRIRMAVELIKEGSRAIGKMMSTLFFPLFPFILQLAVIAYWVVSAVYIASMGSPQSYTNGTNTTDDGGLTYYIKRIPCEDTGNAHVSDICSFVKYGGDKYTVYLEIYMLFMFFWCLNFVIALGQMTLAGAFASYYWAWEKPRDIPTFPLMSALWRCFRFHFGSLAFGSLLVAIVQLVRVFLEYLDSKLKGSENGAAKFVAKCLKCCFWCLEKLIKFINKNAYILIAVYGKNFCTSAKNAFLLIMRNIVRTVVLDRVADFVLFLSKIFVTAAAFVGAFFWFQGRVPFFREYVPNLNYYWTPIVLVGIGAFMIATCFFSVYDMAVDTLFLCFLEDLERHDGSEEKPYYMSKGLMNLLGKENSGRAAAER